MVRRVAVFFLILISGGCQSPQVVKTLVLPNADEASAVLKKIKTSDGKEFVYGHLLIENKQHPLAVVNLDCFKLMYKDKLSDETYLDSYASVDNTIFLAKDGRVSIDAAWSFPVIIDAKLSDFDLVYNMRGINTYDCIERRHPAT